MRTIAIITLGVLLSWLCGADVQAQVAVPTDVSIAVPSPEQILCERECNSDLSLPQQMTVPSARLLATRTNPAAERSAELAGMAGCTCHSNEPFYYRYNDQLLPAVLRAVDVYIYPLHRLRI